MKRTGYSAVNEVLGSIRPPLILALYFSAKHTDCECVRSEAAVFLLNKKPFETNRAEL
jgi:hypothetical protein